ncbi:MAG TPA: ABC transporter permease subunit [Tepidisphaeraceae bacterium]|nr:ABC transporter permease subunit [Tepidisphaeraceae bacterium]
MLGIANYFWRLIPANPILLRVVQMNGKRRRDLFIRCGYLGLLIAMVIFALANNNSGNLSELAKTSANLFQVLSYCQLALVALLAPIFTASAITQEKDSQTYDILLATPLSNGQIVLGSLLSRLFFVIALLISGIPIFSITQIFGGVAISAIVQSFLIAAATAFVTGSVAMAIAVLKVGTRRTIFSFYLFIVAYLAGTYMLDQFSYFKFGVVNPVTHAMDASTTSWLTGLNPFLALATIFHSAAYVPPAFGDLPKNLQGWPTGWYLSNPAGFYTTVMFFISFVLISPSILLLRLLAQSTTSLKTLVLQKLRITPGDRTRKPRVVWSNPIAWREAKTKASAARATLLRYAFMIAGVGGALLMVVMFATYEAPKYPTFIDANSYNSTYNQLSVTSADGSVKTLPLDTSPTFTITYTDEQSAGDTKQDHAKLEGIADLMSRVGSKRLSISATPKVGSAGTESAWASLDAFAINRKLGAPDARQALLGATVVEFAVILLIVTNAAASTVTREKEDGTLDLLLSTPITSRYYIWGKLRGLVSFVLPLVAVPAVSVLFFVVYDLFRRFGNWNDPNFQWIVFPEAVLLLPGMLIIVVAFASILGMHMSLRCRKTVVAVMSSLGIVVGICAAMGFCGYKLLDGPHTGVLGLVAGSFSPFTLLTLLINPFKYAAGSENFVDTEIASSRIMVFVFTWIAVAAYTGVVWSMYKSMVKNFDMTIRKQSR